MSYRPRYLWRVVTDVIPHHGLMRGDLLTADYHLPVMVVRELDWPAAIKCIWFREAHRAGLITPVSPLAQAYAAADPSPAGPPRPAHRRPALVRVS